MFCIKCGKTLSDQDNTPQQNLCINQDCDLHKSEFIYPDDARFCDICGSPTAYASNLYINENTLFMQPK
jgi:hypothetical protein